MSDVNEIRFTGTIGRLQAITTKTGTTMGRWLLKVGPDQFRCVCFGNLAETVLQCRDGDRISVSGTGGINSWKDDEGRWHNDFQVTAWTVEIGGVKTSYRKQEQPPKAEPVARSEKGRDMNQYDYQGGPF